MIALLSWTKQNPERGCKKNLPTYNASPLFIHRGERTGEIELTVKQIEFSGNYLTSQDNVSHFPRLTSTRSAFRSR